MIYIRLLMKLKGNGLSFMYFSKKFFFLSILFFITVFDYSPAFGIETEEFKVFKITPLLAKTVNSNERDAFAGTFTLCDREYYREIEAWHKKSTAELKDLDLYINHSGAKSGYRNLCALHISVVYNTAGTRTKKDVFFEDDIFLSGRNLSEIKPQGFSLGQVELSRNLFTVQLEPGIKDDKLQTLTEGFFEVALSHTAQSTNLPLMLKKRFVSLDEFCPGSLEYEKHIIEYFDFSSILEEKPKQDIKRAFKQSLSLALKQNPFLNVSNIVDQSGDSLDKALLLLPFNTASNVKAQKYFEKTADELFGQFKYNFCDSEQAIRLFIYQKGDFLGKILGIDGGISLDVGDIEQIYINISSVRYMCSICQGTYSYDIKEKGTLLKSIFFGIMRAQKKDLSGEAVENLLKKLHSLVIVYTSGIKPTVKD